MKICALSDIHGQLIEIHDSCDIVCICGDILPLSIQLNGKKSRRWLTDSFLPWCDNLPCDKVFYIAGNHDFFFYNHRNDYSSYNVSTIKTKYLYCESIEYKGLKIYGTPWCRPFYNWAFNLDETEQTAFYNTIESKKQLSNIDILLTHDAPYGVSDVLLQQDYRYSDGKHIGNQAITDLIKETNPHYCFHGHLHSSNHDLEMLNNTHIYNVSILDEYYNATFKPLYITISEDKNEAVK